ncbi:MAG: hypothetical protein JRI68_13875 [Deltaproteobacteria bacterium]|nr:hypothetical protein [Deltaproteobacteria bacterium]
MMRTRCAAWVLAVALGASTGCPRPAEPERRTHPSTASAPPALSRTPAAPSSAIAKGAEPAAASSAVASDGAASGRAGAATGSAPAGPPPLPERTTIAFGTDRSAYVVLPHERKGAARLIVGLHGVCNPPEYACGYWIEAAARRGLLICPTGNARCGPAMSRAPTWTQSAVKIDEDLEAAVAAVDAAHPGLAARDGAILMGFSRGAYAAVKIAAAHPGRWPHLVLVEANVQVSADSLGKAGVRSVALIAGERSGQLVGQRRTAEQLTRQQFPAKLWVMPGAGHHYSADIDEIMAAALDFVVESGMNRP